MPRTILALLTLTLATVHGAEQLDPFAPKTTMRYPIVAVPTLRGPVNVDGDPTKVDWQFSTMLQDFVSLDLTGDNGFAANEQTTVWLSCNEHALYVGFKMQMQEGVAPRITITEGRDQGFNDDAFEMFLMPDEASGMIFHLGGTAGGVWWDRKLTPKPEWEWNPAVTYHATVDKERGFWSGEWVIPWEAFGRAMPREGDVWRANFIANRRAPEHRLDSWSYWRKWLDNANDGRIIFGGTRPSFSMVYPTAEAWKGRGVFPAVANPLGEKSPRQIQCVVDLYRKKQSGGNSFLKDLQARRDRATGEGATFASYEKDLDDTLADYELVQHQPGTTPLPAPKFSAHWGPRLRVEQPGDYLLAWWFKDITDQNQPLVVAGGAVPFRIRVGVQAETHPFLLTRQSIVLIGDLRAVENRAVVKKVRGIVTDIGATNALAETTVPYDGNPKQDVEVSVATLAVGKAYETRYQVLDGAGNVMSEAVGKFTRPPDPDWWVNRSRWGAEPEVPKPWTPVRWNNGRAEVWGRQISFGKSPLPTHIINQGNEILAHPIALELSVGGKVQPWRSKSLQLVEKRPGQVVFETRCEAAGVRVNGRTQFEFDGFSLVELEIAPINGKAQLDRLDLVIAVRSKHAAFLTNYRNAPGPGKPVARFVGKTPDHYESPVMLTTWLGTDHGGLEWSCESSRDWRLSKPDKAIEVNRKGDIVEARFHLIDEPMTLDRIRKIRFGLVATPTKPVPPECRNLRIDYVAGMPPVPGKSKPKTGAVATEEDLKKFREMYGSVDAFACLIPINWSGYDAWHPPVKDPAKADLVRSVNRLASEDGQRVLWNGGWAVAPYAPEWDPWGREMVSWPVNPTFANQYEVSYASPYVEFMVGAWRSHVRDLGVGGIRFDTVFPWHPSENPYLGETWVADDGKTYGSQNLFRQRELLKRLYRVFQPTPGDHGLFWLGIAGPPIMAVESFIDLHEVAEGFYMNAKSVKEGYSQDAVRVWMTSAPYGFLEVNNVKGNPLRDINRIGALLVADASPRISARPGFNSPTYTPSRHQEVPATRIWDAWSWINRATAQWCPHWENKGMIQTDGKGEHYVSFHLQKGRRILLVAANYEKDPQQVRVQFNRKALGFHPDALLEAQDGVTLEKIELQRDTLILDILPELFRVVKIGAAEELRGPSLDPRHPAANPANQ